MDGEQPGWRKRCTFHVWLGKLWLEMAPEINRQLEGLAPPYDTNHPSLPCMCPLPNNSGGCVVDATWSRLVGKSDILCRNWVGVDRIKPAIHLHFCTFTTRTTNTHLLSNLLLINMNLISQIYHHMIKIYHQMLKFIIYQ